MGWQDAPLVEENPDEKQAAWMGAPVIEDNNTQQKPTSFLGEMGQNFRQGIQSGKDLLSGDFEDIGRPRNTPKTQALADKLFPAGSDGSFMDAVHNVGNTNPSDWSGSLLEKLGNSPEGKLLSLIGGVNPLYNAFGTAANRYVNPAISKTTGIAPENLQLMELAASTLGLKGAGNVSDPSIAALKSIGGSASDALGSISNKLIGSITDSGANKAAIEGVAKILQKQGINPDDIIARMQGAQDAGVPITLPEATNSSTLLNRQKVIEQSSGEGSNILRDFKADRPGQIRDALGNYADDIVNTATTTAKPLYEQASDVQLPGTTDQYINKTTPNPAIKDLLSNPVISDAAKAFNDNKELSYAVRGLPKNSIGYFDEIKKYLDSKSQGSSDDLYLSKIYGGAAKQITDTLDQISPEYAQARAAAQPGIVARNEIQDALGATRDNSIGVLRNRIFGSPDQRAELQRGLGQENYNNLDKLIGYIDDASKTSVGGSDTYTKLQAAQELKNNTGAGLSNIIGIAGKPIDALLNWYGEKAYQKDWKAMADLFTTKDINALGQQLKAATPDQKSGILSNFISNKVPATIQPQSGLGKAINAAPSALNNLPGAAGVINSNNIPVQSIQKLLKNPHLASDFDAKYGTGASSLYLEAAKPKPVAPIAPEPQASMPQDPITMASQLTGANADLLSRIAGVESAGNPNAKNPNSSATGLFQITKPTWMSLVSKYGKDYGVTMKDITDPESNAIMGAKLMQDNTEKLKKEFGRDPSEGEIYLAHVLGASDAIKLMQSSPYQTASTLFPKAAKANRAIFFDGNKPRTVTEVYQKITNKI